MNSDYKKYSLEQLENWMHDVMSSAEASPQEIYDTIKKVVEENYYYYKKNTESANELLALLNGNVRYRIPIQTNLESSIDNHFSECQNSWEVFWEPNIETTETNSPKKENINHKWVVPIENDWTITFPEDLIEQVGWKVNDVLEWYDQGDGSFKLIKKEPHPSWIKGNELARVKTYQEMIDDGWTLTEEYWIKEN